MDYLENYFGGFDLDNHCFIYFYLIETIEDIGRGDASCKQRYRKG